MIARITDAHLDAIATNDFIVLDDFLPKETALQLLQEIKYWQEQEAFKKAGIGKLENFDIDTEFRKDYIKWINKNDCLSTTAKYLDFISELILLFNRNFFLSLKDYESMYAIYPTGSYYKKHRDQFIGQAHRIITCVLYLNENWEQKNGGDIIIYQNKKRHQFSPIFNRLIIFKSKLWHEVKPCNQTRYSITTWLKDQYNDVNFL